MTRTVSITVTYILKWLLLSFAQPPHSTATLTVPHHSASTSACCATLQDELNLQLSSAGPTGSYGDGADPLPARSKQPPYRPQLSTGQATAPITLLSSRCSVTLPAKGSRQAKKKSNSTVESFSLPGA